MLIISLYSAQNTVHIEFNFSLLILDKNSIEVIIPVYEMVVTALTR
jgi:hypothetical protein